MAQENKISAEIPAATVTDAKSKIEEIRSMLASVLTANLSGADRQNMKLSVRQAIYPMFIGKLEKIESLRVVERD